MFRRSSPSEAVRSHRRARPSPWQWLAAPARRAAVLAVSGALALAGVVVAVATVGTPEQDTASTQAEGGSTGAAGASSEAGLSPDRRSPVGRSASRSGSSVTGSAASAGKRAARSPASGGSSTLLTPSAVLGLTPLTQLAGSSARTPAGSPTRAGTTSTATQSSTESPTRSTATQSPTTSSPLPTLTPTSSSPLPTLTPGKPPGSSLHPTPGHGSTHAIDKN